MERLLRPKEACQLLSISYSTLLRWIREGKIRVVTTEGGKYRIPYGEIKKYLERKEETRAVIYARVYPSYLILLLFAQSTGRRSFTNPMGAMPQGLVFVRRGKRGWHRDVVALYNLRKRAGDVSPVPLGSKESHDPPTVSRWLRVKSLHSIVIEDKMK